VYQVGDTDGDDVPNVVVLGVQSGQAEFATY
jgi:hypothetical protein